MVALSEPLASILIYPHEYLHDFMKFISQINKTTSQSHNSMAEKKTYYVMSSVTQVTPSHLRKTPKSYPVLKHVGMPKMIPQLEHAVHIN
jgi:hypothetical protein